jgi:hypothetical protein
LPKDAKLGSVPTGFQIERPGYSMKGSFITDKSTIIYKREVIIKKTEVSNQHFPEWNTDIDKLNEFYNNQLTITK